MNTELDPVHTKIKQSKFLLNAGRVNAAKDQIEAAWRVAASNREFTHHLPIIEHRIAMVLKSLKQHKLARARFVHALRTFDTSDKMGLAILLRDYGSLLAIELHDYDTGRERIMDAYELLEDTVFPDELQKRTKLELLTTKGFEYRVRLRMNRYDRSALVSLKEVYEELRELAETKPGYELDILSWILSYELDPKEMNRYLPRALYLSARLGNVTRTAEYTFYLSGGQYARSVLSRFF